MRRFVFVAVEASMTKRRRSGVHPVGIGPPAPAMAQAGDTQRRPWPPLRIGGDHSRTAICRAAALACSPGNASGDDGGAKVAANAGRGGVAPSSARDSTLSVCRHGPWLGPVLRSLACWGESPSLRRDRAEGPPGYGRRVSRSMSSQLRTRSFRSTTATSRPGPQSTTSRVPSTEMTWSLPSPPESASWP